MSLIAEIDFQHPDLPLVPTLQANPDLDVRAELQPSGGEQGVFYVVDGGAAARFEASIDGDHTVADWRSLQELGSDRIYHATVAADTPGVVPEMIRYGMRVLDLWNRGGLWSVRAQVPDRDALDSLRAHCGRVGVEFRLRKLYRAVDYHGIDGGGELDITDRQREVATVATEMGYFDPDGADAETVADALGISKSTLSTHLRAVTATVFRDIFGE